MLHIQCVDLALHATPERPVHTSAAASGGRSERAPCRSRLRSNLRQSAVRVLFAILWNRHTPRRPLVPHTRPFAGDLYDRHPPFWGATATVPELAASLVAAGSASPAARLVHTCLSPWCEANATLRTPAQRLRAAHLVRIGLALEHCLSIPGLAHCWVVPSSSVDSRSAEVTSRRRFD